MSSFLRPRHFFTVDVEDYFHSEDPDPSGWDRHLPRVEGPTRGMLELCAGAGVRGTFFVLGWVARRHPGLVREIAAAGHEIASHGFDHQFVYRQGPAAFRSDVRRAREVLEDLTGLPVRGYRAPCFSIVERTPWAHEILAEVGYTYSSSVFPGSNPRYGIPGHSQAPVPVTTASGARIWEVPVTTFLSRIGCGGVYFRALPYRWFASRIGQREQSGRSVVFYIHPWEIDPGKPSARGSLGLRLRHSIGIRATASRLRRLLAAFEFEPIGPRLAEGDLHPMTAGARA
jgi:polysaccharide deacetylase family protein (PEP-CTERM system associated)